MEAFPKNILMTIPNGFRVEYVINEFMKDESGKLKEVDPGKAIAQWNNLKAIYQKLGFNIKEMEGDPSLPDMVFCANTFFSCPFEGSKRAVVSNMAHPERAEETELVSKWLEERGYELIHLDPGLRFESMGDAIWDYERREIYGGIGPRTSAQVYEKLSEILPWKIYPLKLIHKNFYHLDTCLSIFDQNCASYVPEAFAPESIEVLKEKFPTLIEIGLQEASENFAANAHCPDGKNVIVQSGTSKFKRDCQSAGFNVIEVETGEFMKSGGSVFCMKNQYF